MELVGKLHGMPKSTTSDRDPLFISKFWQALFSLSVTKLRMSSAYHPQTNGQNEVANRVIDNIYEPLSTDNQHHGGASCCGLSGHIIHPLIWPLS